MKETVRHHITLSADVRNQVMTYAKYLGGAPLVNAIEKLISIGLNPDLAANHLHKMALLMVSMDVDDPTPRTGSYDVEDGSQYDRGAPVWEAVQVQVTKPKERRARDDRQEVNLIINKELSKRVYDYQRLVAPTETFSVVIEQLILIVLKNNEKLLGVQRDFLRKHDLLDYPEPS